MGLYWKDIEIVPGMLLSVEFIRPEAYNRDGEVAAVWWKILSFDSRDSSDAYIDYACGKKYPLEKVVRKRRLQARLERGELLQLPSGSDFMIVQEFHDGEPVYKRCYNLDMLHTIRNIRVRKE